MGSVAVEKLRYKPNMVNHGHREYRPGAEPTIPQSFRSLCLVVGLIGWVKNAPCLIWHLYQGGEKYALELESDPQGEGWGANITRSRRERERVSESKKKVRAVPRWDEKNGTLSSDAWDIASVIWRWKKQAGREKKERRLIRHSLHL